MIALLQCTSNYPNPYGEVNLGVIQFLKSKYNLPVGYSDHTKDTQALILAAALGAEILEFHFTDSKLNKTFRDHFVSLDRNEIDLLVEEIIKNNIMIGKSHKSHTHSEVLSNNVLSFRRSLYAKRDIYAGEILSNENIISDSDQILEYALVK